MTTTEAVETSVINSLSQDYTNLDGLLSPTNTLLPYFIHSQRFLFLYQMLLENRFYIRNKPNGQNLPNGQ